MTDKSAKKIFIIIWALLLINFAANFLLIGFELIKASESLFAYLTTISSLILFGSFFTGLLIYLVAGPWLLKKHEIKTFTESYLWLNWIYTEIELKKLEPSIGDLSVKRTVTALKICKLGIVIGLILLPIFAFLLNA